MTIRFHWGVGITLVYIAFALGTLSVVALATSTRVDLVSEDYYQRALTFDRQIEASARGQSAGVRIALEAEPRRQLVLEFPDATLPVTSGVITLYRASGSSSDRSWPLALDPAGRQSLPLDSLQSGHWLAQLRWIRDGRDAYIEQEIVIP